MGKVFNERVSQSRLTSELSDHLNPNSTSRSSKQGRSGFASRKEDASVHIFLPKKPTLNKE